MAKRHFTAAAALCLAILAASPAFGAGSQGSAKAPAGGDSDATDVIVLLDVSQSVLPYFQDVTDYVVSSVVKDYLRYGDTFHLLSFGETAQSEIAQRMSSEADVKSVLGKLYLLYPLARYSDFVGALSYLYQYIVDLPESRRKVVVIITDGMHNPPPSSSTFGMAPEKVKAEIETAAARIRANGWPVNIIKLPFPKPGEAGAPAPGSSESHGQYFLDDTARALGATVSDFAREGKTDIARKSLSLPAVEFPGPLGKKDFSFSFPLKVKNGSDSAVGFELDRVRLGNDDILTKKSFLTLQSGRSGTMDIPVLIPDSVPQGESKLAIRLHFANGVRVSPDTGVLELSLSRSPLAAFLRSGARVVLFAVILVLGLAAILGIIIMLRRMSKGVEAPITAAVRQTEAAYATASSSTAIAGAAAKKAALAAAAAGLSARESDRAAKKAAASAAAASLASIAASRREEAARSAALLAQAAGMESAETAATRGRGAFKRSTDEHEAAIESLTADIAEQKHAESERTAAILAEASGRRSPAARLSGRAEAKARAVAATYASRIAKPGSVQIELVVSEQNQHIGSRNVHRISAGGSKSVGGGSSDFLVFLVKVPRKSAELHFDGEKLAFVPVRPELFPGLDGPVEDCLGKDISMISRSGYPLTLRFVAYEKPIEKLNKLLHCIDTAGL
jgi:hypothetical protein